MSKRQRQKNQRRALPLKEPVRIMPPLDPQTGLPPVGALPVDPLERARVKHAHKRYLR